MAEDNGQAEAPKEDPEERLRRELATPISREDAEKAYADIDVERMKLLIVRHKWQAQISQMTLRVQALDEQLTALDLNRAVIFRRSLIGTEQKADE